MQQLLGDRVVDRLRAAQGVIRLGDRYGAGHLDAACARALERHIRLEANDRKDGLVPSKFQQAGRSIPARSSES